MIAVTSWQPWRHHGLSKAMSRGHLAQESAQPLLLQLHCLAQLPAHRTLITPRYHALLFPAVHLHQVRRPAHHRTGDLAATLPAWHFVSSVTMPHKVPPQRLIMPKYHALLFLQSASTKSAAEPTTGQVTLL